jgi:hypothetical protein
VGDKEAPKHLALLLIVPLLPGLHDSNQHDHLADNCTLVTILTKPQLLVCDSDWLAAPAAFLSTTLWTH